MEYWDQVCFVAETTKFGKRYFRIPACSVGVFVAIWLQLLPHGNEFVRSFREIPVFLILEAGVVEIWHNAKAMWKGYVCFIYVVYQNEGC